MAKDPARHRFIDHVLEMYEGPGWRRRRMAAIIFAAIVFPVAVLAAVSYAKINRDLVEFASARRQAVAYLAATTLRARFDRLIDVGASLAENADLQEFVVRGKWQDAANTLRDIPGEVLPAVDRLFLASPDGTELAAVPEVDSAVGKSFAYQDWYKGVSRNWQPYVSNAYKRAVEPSLNVIAVAVPIKDDSQKVVGILVMQIRLETLLAWGRGIDVGSTAFVFFVDRNGFLAAHPQYDPQGAIVDFSGFPPVQKARQLERGVEIVYDPALERDVLVAYEPVIRYGWTVVVEQPAESAFAERNNDTRVIMLAFGFIFLVNCLLALIVLNAISTVLALRRRERVFVESLGEGVAATDGDGFVQFLNPAASAMLGWTSEAARGNHWDDLVNPREERKSGEREHCSIRLALRGSKVTQKCVYGKKDGTIFPVAATATPIIASVTSREGEAPTVTGSIIVFRDITKEEELDRAKKEFISIASHQLLTPVSAAKGYLSMLLDGDFGAVTEKQKDFLGRLFQLNQRMVDLVDDLLNVSRVELGVLDASKPEAVDIAVLARAEIDAVRPLSLAKKLKVEEDIASEMQTIDASPKLLRIILQNLLSNAIKYTPDEGVVRLAARMESDAEKGRMVHLTVTDSGFGIPPEEQSKIFTKFFRAENVRVRGVEGTGLGLYIVKSVIDLMRGKIWFESHEDRGTTFHVTFPARQRQEP